MAYNTGGEGHRGALLDEAGFADWLNSGNHKKFSWPKGEVFDRAEQAGGTQQIEDVVAIMKSKTHVTFSNKQAKTGVATHSHTWQNNSPIFTRLQREESKITDPFSKVKKFAENEVSKEPDFRKRRLYREAYEAVMKAGNTQVRDNLNQALIEEIFKTGFEHISGGADYMVITDVPDRTHYIFESSKHPICAATSLGYEIEFRRNASPSTLPSLEDIMPEKRDDIIEKYGLRVGRRVQLQPESLQIPNHLHKHVCEITAISGTNITVETADGPLVVDIQLWPTPIKAPEDLGNESGKIFLIKKKRWWECLKFWEKAEVFDPGLRLRVKHNNGVSDLFKQGGPAEGEEKNSGGGSFVATIQQDPGSVQTLLRRIEERGNLIKVKY